ncbi:hypothetical protein CQ042_18080 [Microbacterium sp. MYb62]|nr:hypothetical protein CQ042_18080 [Microbacterium sp. MYb62]
MKEHTLSRVGSPRLAVSAAVSDDHILTTCLAASPDIESGAFELQTYRDYPSAAIALNDALESAKTEWVVLAHQDVYFPARALTRLEEMLDGLSEDVAVVGVIGRTPLGETVGEAWSSGMSKIVGVPLSEASDAITLDEVVIIVRRASGVRFDPALPGFHLYATDIALTADEAGKRVAVVPLTVVHHSRPVISLGSDYAAAYRFLQRKWSARLPVLTMMGDIRRFPLHLARLDFRVRRASGFAQTRRAPVGDPAEIARSLGLTP